MCVLLIRMSWQGYIDNLKTPDQSGTCPVSEAAICGITAGQESVWASSPGIQVTVHTNPHCSSSCLYKLLNICKKKSPLPPLKLLPRVFKQPHTQKLAQTGDINLHKLPLLWLIFCCYEKISWKQLLILHVRVFFLSFGCVQFVACLAHFPLSVLCSGAAGKHVCHTGFFLKSQKFKAWLQRGKSLSNKMTILSSLASSLSF